MADFLVCALDNQVSKNSMKNKLSTEFWYNTKGVLNGRADVILLGLK